MNINMNLHNNIILKPEKFSRATENGQRLRDCLIYEKSMARWVSKLHGAKFGRWAAKFREMGG